LLYLGRFLFIGHVGKGQRQHDVKSLFRNHGATSRYVHRTREAPFEIIQNDGNRDTCRRERDCNDTFSFQSLMRELWQGLALRRLHRSPFDCFCSKECIRAASKWLPDFTCQLRTVQLTALAYGRSQPRH
jgi:hypothetical protein